MDSQISRREFLKLSSLLASSLYLPSFLAPASQDADDEHAKNILVIVFDAFSAKNSSLFGYSRETTPNLARLAENAIVYHNHYAGGSWTYPGTATLLTGVYPWAHRGFGLGRDIVSPYDQGNIFGLFADYHRVAYTHNPFADVILSQFKEVIDLHEPSGALLLSLETAVGGLFANDPDTASLSWTRTAKKLEEGYANSLFLSNLYQLFGEIHEQTTLKPHLEKFPLELPRVQGTDNYFILEDAIDWISLQASSLPKPFLGYFHLLPPHFPYKTRKEFYNAFRDDDFKPVQKPISVFNNQSGQEALDFSRKEYDEYILYVDAEFERLFKLLEANKVFDNTWVILTSDHGEMFERGIRGHRAQTFHEPVIKVPLLIWEPGRKAREDVFTSTVAVDLLPTLLHLNGKKFPEYLEGKILPPFEKEASARNIYALDARNTIGRSSAISVATAMMLKEDYKITYYFGYPELPDSKRYFELYDVKNDPEELENLYSENSSLSKDLAAEIVDKVNKENEPYE